jgi:hypothetical protein
MKPGNQGKDEKVENGKWKLAKVEGKSACFANKKLMHNAQAQDNIH